MTATVIAGEYVGLRSLSAKWCWLPNFYLYLQGCSTSYVTATLSFVLSVTSYDSRSHNLLIALVRGSKMISVRHEVKSSKNDR